VPAYVIVEIDVHDTGSYGPYVEGATTSVALAGGRYLARGGATQSLEGDPPSPRVVVMTFPDLEAAVAWYNSDAYQAVLPIRLAAATSRMFVVEGLPTD
jgi:uncharacterized protein (DUF1330 family)